MSKKLCCLCWSIIERKGIWLYRQHYKLSLLEIKRQVRYVEVTSTYHLATGLQNLKEKRPSEQADELEIF